MPQLDFGNVLTISQVVWMALIFGTFYLLLTNWGLPQVGAVIEARAEAIRSDLEAAQTAKAAADAATAQLTASTQKARAEAQAAVAAAVEQAQKRAAAEAAAANAALAQRLEAAEARIADQRGAALGALRDVATETTAALVSRLTGRPVDTGAVSGAVDAALAARGNA